jgi:hypothetical protein
MTHSRTTREPSLSHAVHRAECESVLDMQQPLKDDDDDVDDKRAFLNRLADGLPESP